MPRLVQIVDDQGRNLAAAVDIQPVEAVDHDTAAAKGARLHPRASGRSFPFTSRTTLFRMGTRPDWRCRMNRKDPSSGQFQSCPESARHPAACREDPRRDRGPFHGPFPVAAKEPYISILHFHRLFPEKFPASSIQSATAPAVCELDGPTITGPRISNKFILLLLFKRHPALLFLVLLEFRSAQGLCFDPVPCRHSTD